MSNASKFIALSLFFIAPAFVSAQISITGIANPFTQNFNSLAASGTSNAWTNNSTIPGWYAAKTSGAVATYRANDGTSNAANLCSFGTANNTDRALGSVGAGGSSFAWGVRFKNNTANTTINSVKVTFTGEQWRVSTSLREQPVRFSYFVSAGAINTFSATETGYLKVPFANFISPVYSGADVALDGNAGANRVQVVMRFKVAVAPGREIMLKWFDADDSQFDHALGIDDVSVQFYSNATVTDEFTGATSLEHFMKGVILDIPAQNSGVPYALPSAAQLTKWGDGITLLLGAQYGNAFNKFHNANNNLGYRLTKYVTSTRTYYIVSKDGASANHWGTYVFSPGSTRPCVNFQAPHPLHDAKTGEQAAWLFRETDAFSLMVAGAHRCLSAVVSGCSGTDSPCAGQQRISDVAHVVGSAFEKTTEVVAAGGSNRRFLQMHGFAQGDNPFHFVLSNGTDLTPANDRAAQLDAALEAVVGKNWQSRVAHLDNPGMLTAYNNIQGRYLNSYADGNICSSNIVSNTVTGRFLHIEQYEAAREDPTNYPLLRDALLANAIFDCAAPNLQNSSDRTTGSTENAVEIRQSNDEANDLTCYLQSGQLLANIQIVNTVGQVCTRQTVEVFGSAEFKIPTEGLAAGVYFLVADFGVAERKTVKFVVR